MNTDHLSKAELAKEARKYDRINNDGGEGYNPYWDALKDRLALEAREADAAFAAEWTPEVTATRRAEWNARVQSGEFGVIGSGRTDLRAVAAQEQAQGWTMEQLKRAIALHK